MSDRNNPDALGTQNIQETPDMAEIERLREKVASLEEKSASLEQEKDLYRDMALAAESNELTLRRQYAELQSQEVRRLNGEVSRYQAAEIYRLKRDLALLSQERTPSPPVEAGRDTEGGESDGS